MSDANLEETRPVRAAEDIQAAQEPTEKSRWWVWALVGVITLILITGLSAYEGYLAGLQRQDDTQKTEMAKSAQEQFELGVRDMEAGLYARARQRFEYVIDLEPNYPGVTEKLAEVLMALNTTATATPVPTPTLTPTPDLRAAEDLFFQAERQLAEEDWNGALETLDTLRGRQPDYRAIDVDGMYYVALRNRGIEKISLDGNLEGGIYDLTRAERFGPLDADAQAWRSWSRMYIAGASFWDVDWIQAINIFSELALIAPNIHDASNLTATERLRLAYIHYGDLLASIEDYCNAQIQYENALSIGPDPTLEPTATQTARDCRPPTPRPRRRTPTPKITPTGEVPPGETPSPPPPTTPPPQPTPTATPGS